MLPQIWPAILTLGWILVAIAGSEALMALFSLAAGDGYADDFALSAAVTLMVGGACILTTKGRPFEMRFRDAALLTVATWVLVPAFAAIPLVTPPLSLSLVDAYFEMVSGMTTTGSTVLVGLDSMPPTVLLWRSTIQWIGGVGIIGLAIVVLPFLKIGGMQLFRLESSDRSEKSLPDVRGLASAVGRIYVLLTLACFVTYWLLGMTPFDALNHAFTTLPTAGYSTHDRSFAYFDSPPLEWAGTVFMIAGALPFLAYLRFVRGSHFRERVDPQVKSLVILLALSTLVFAAYVHFAHGVDPGTALTKAAFNVTSIVTTTGFASADYLVWGAFASAFFFFLMFTGGCTGSTSGGIKVFRLRIVGGIVKQHVRRAIHPHAVVPVRYDGRAVPDEQLGSVGIFVFLYFATTALVAIALALMGLDTETALSAAATAVGNVGPGIGPVIGLAGNFAPLPDAAKMLLCAAMIVGRLEILGVLILFLPSFYR